MQMRVNTGAEGIIRSMQRTDREHFKAQSKLATGLENADPATGPFASTVSKGLSADVSSAEQVHDTVLQAANTVEVASSVLKSSLQLLSTMKEIAVRACNDTYNEADRAQLDAQIQKLVAQFDGNAASKWGTRVLFDGTFSMNCQTGMQTTEVTTITLGDMTAATVIDGLDVTTQEEAQASLAKIDAAFQTVAEEIERIELYSTDFNRIGESIGVSTQNLQSALSLYEDADFARSATDLQRLNILRNAATAVLKMDFASFDKLGHLVGESLNRR